MPINAQDYLKPDSGEFAGHRILNAETGWPEVRKGLGLIVLGHISAILCILAFFYMNPFMEALIKGLQVGTGKGEGQWATGAFVLAWFIIGLLYVVSLCTIIAGQWKCLWAPERHWAKQLVFASLSCFVICQLLWGVNRMILWFGGEMANFALAYEVLGLISLVIFVLFLRAVACCFDNAVRVWSVNLFFLLVALVVAGSYYTGYEWEDFVRVVKDLWLSVKEGRMVWGKDTQGVLGLGLGWVLIAVWYIMLVWSARGSVIRGLRLRRSPLEPAA